MLDRFHLRYINETVSVTFFSSDIQLIGSSYEISDGRLELLFK